MFLQMRRVWSYRIRISKKNRQHNGQKKKKIVNKNVLVCIMSSKQKRIGMYNVFVDSLSGWVKAVRSLIQFQINRLIMSINTISKKNRQHNGQKKKKIVRGLI
jgi:hypothetical protein